MFRSYDASKMESWTSRPALLGPRRLVFIQSTTALVVLLAVAITGAVWWGADASRTDESLEAAASPGTGVIVRFEAIHLWLPEAVGELASPKVRREVVRDHDGLRRFLDQRGRKTFRYAVTFRCHQLNGGWSEITFVRSPFDGLRDIQPFSTVLAATGGPDRGATIHIIPEALLNLDPSAMIAEMKWIVDQDSFNPRPSS